MGNVKNSETQKVKVEAKERKVDFRLSLNYQSLTKSYEEQDNELLVSQKAMVNEKVEK